MNRKFAIAASLLLILPTAGWTADDGAALYKKKCAACHGAGGEGKPAVKVPAVKETAWDVNKITEHLTKGEASSKPPHKKGVAGLSEEQARAIAEYVKTLK